VPKAGERAWTAPESRYDHAYRVLRGPLRDLTDRVVGAAEAEDVVQEAFLRLAEDPVVTRSDADVAAWLRRVALNLAFNRLRDLGRWRARAERAGRLAQHDGAAEEPLATVLRAEQRAAVRRALADLPARQRDCLLLRHTGLSYAEIATTLEMPVSSVGTTLARAARAFRTRYESQE